MKRRLSVLFFLSLVAWLITQSSLVLASEVNSLEQASPSATLTHVQYDLAFPGILPDHMFYKLKVLRDKVTSFLIRDANSKLLFYLKLADKGILASAMLIDKGNVDLSTETALKAEHNMTLVTTYLGWIDRKKDPTLLSKLKTASLKHQEVLRSLIQRVPPEKQQAFQTVLEFSERNLRAIEQFESESQ